MKKLLVFLLVINFAYANKIEEIFKEYNIEGTIVIKALNKNIQYIYNEQRAKKALLPASTFKIPNSLIILNEKLLKDENEIVKWDNKKRFLEVWNKDQTLKTAFKYSCVWCYQKYSKEISIDKYKYYLKQFNYGNKKVGKSSYDFWLQGDIKISALEQIEFLKNLYLENLPVEKKYINIVKNIMIEEKAKEYILSSKTGWATFPKEKHGWYVGYIQTKEEVWFFATNLLISDFNKLSLRKELTFKVFKTLGII